MQVQPVVVLPPRGRDLVALLDQDERPAALLQAGGDCQPGRPGADDEGLNLYGFDPIFHVLACG